MEMTKRSIQNAIYQECVEFHPFLEMRYREWFVQNKIPFPRPFSRRSRSNTLAH